MDLPVFYRGSGQKVKMKVMNTEPVSDKVLIKNQIAEPADPEYITVNVKYMQCLVSNL